MTTYNIPALADRIHAATGIEHGTQDMNREVGLALTMFALDSSYTLDDGTVLHGHEFRTTGDTARPERRALNRKHRAEVAHMNGYFVVRAGESETEAHDQADAYRIAFAHNHINGHALCAAELRAVMPATQPTVIN